VKKDKLSFPNQLTDLERRLRTQLDEKTFNEVARYLLMLEPLDHQDRRVEGLDAIAEFGDLTIDQIKKLSPELQNLGVLRKINKYDGKQKRQVVVGYESHLRKFFKNFPASQKEVFKQMRRKARYHDCPKCDYRIYV
jgi:hypothetical protein